MRTYQELLNSAQDSFAQVLELRSDLREFLVRSPNFELSDFNEWQEEHGHIVEGIAQKAVPEDVSDAALLTLLREKPALMAREAFTSGNSIRQLTIEGVREFIEQDILIPLGLHESQHQNATAPKP